MSYNDTSITSQDAQAVKPSTTRGLSSLDSIGNESSDLASTLGGVAFGQSSQTFSPNNPSPLATQQPASNMSSGTQGFSQSNLPSNFNSSDPGALLDRAGDNSVTSSGTSLAAHSTSGSTIGIPNDSTGSSGLSGNSGSSFGGSSLSGGNSASTSMGTGPETGAGRSASGDFDGINKIGGSTNSSSSGLGNTSNTSSGLSSGLGNTSSGLSSGLGNTSSSSTGNTSSGSGSLDIGGAQTSGTGLTTPGGVVKGDGHVENLVTAMGGVVLTAPVALYEAVAGRVTHHANNAREVANQQGLGDAANQAGGMLQNVAGMAQQKVNELNASRGPDAPPISQTLQAYATSAAQQAQTMAAQAATSAQNLVGRAHQNAPSAGELKQTAADTTNRAANSTAQTTSGVGATINSYVHSAQDAAANIAHSASVQAQAIGARVGLTSPTQSSTIPATSSTSSTTSTDGPSAMSASGSSGLSGTNTVHSSTPSTGVSDDTVSGRYDMAQGELPSENVTRTSTSGLDLPQTSSTGAPISSNNPYRQSGNVDLPSDLKSADSSATVGQESVPYPDSIAQPGAASYGQGRVGSTQ